MKNIPDNGTKVLFKTPDYQLPDASGHFGH